MTEQEILECEAEVANHRQLNPAQLEKLFAAARVAISSGERAKAREAEELSVALSVPKKSRSKQAD